MQVGCIRRLFIFIINNAIYKIKSKEDKNER